VASKRLQASQENIFKRVIAAYCSSFCIDNNEFDDVSMSKSLHPEAEKYNVQNRNRKKEGK